MSICGATHSDRCENPGVPRSGARVPSAWELPASCDAGLCKDGDCSCRCSTASSAPQTLPSTRWALSKCVLSECTNSDMHSESAQRTVAAGGQNVSSQRALHLPSGLNVCRTKPYIRSGGGSGRRDGGGGPGLSLQGLSAGRWPYRSYPVARPEAEPVVSKATPAWGFRGPCCMGRPTFIGKSPRAS